MNNKVTPFYFRNLFLIPAVISVLLIMFVVGLFIVLTKTELESNIIQNSISLVTMVVTGITLVFLYKTLKQQQEQIEQNEQGTDLNRILDIVYRHLEISLPQVKSHSTYRILNRIMNDYQSSDYERAQDIENASESILTFLINTKGLIQNFIFIIKNSNLDLEKKNLLETSYVIT